MKVPREVSFDKKKVECFFWADLPCEHVKVRRCVKGHVVYSRPYIEFCEKSCPRYVKFVREMEAEEEAFFEEVDRIRRGEEWRKAVSER